MCVVVPGMLLEPGGGEGSLGELCSVLCWWDRRKGPPADRLRAVMAWAWLALSSGLLEPGTGSSPGCHGVFLAAQSEKGTSRRKGGKESRSPDTRSAMGFVKVSLSGETDK